MAVERVAVADVDVWVVVAVGRVSVTSKVVILGGGKQVDGQ